MRYKNKDNSNSSVYINCMYRLYVYFSIKWWIKKAKRRQHCILSSSLASQMKTFLSIFYNNRAHKYILRGHTLVLISNRGRALNPILMNAQKKDTNCNYALHVICNYKRQNFKLHNLYDNTKTKTTHISVKIN